MINHLVQAREHYKKVNPNTNSYLLKMEVEVAEKDGEFWYHHCPAVNKLLIDSLEDNGIDTLTVENIMHDVKNDMFFNIKGQDLCKQSPSAFKNFFIELADIFPNNNYSIFVKKVETMYRGNEEVTLKSVHVPFVLVYDNVVEGQSFDYIVHFYSKVLDKHYSINKTNGEFCLNKDEFVCL